MKHSIVRLAFAAIILAGTLHAQVPRLINYQGRIAVGSVNFDGAGKFKFALVDGAGATTFWSNDGSSIAGSEPALAVTLTVSKGLYSALLGDVSLANMSALPASVFTKPDVRLRVWFNDGVNGWQRFTPDQRLAPAAYLSDGAVTSASIADAAIVAAKIAPGAIDGSRLAPASIAFNHLAVPVAPGAGQVLGFNGAGLNWIAPGAAAGDGIWTRNGANTIFFNGNVAVGTDTPQFKFHLYDATASVTSVVETGGGTNSWAKVAFKNALGRWDIGTSRAFNNDVFYIDRIGTLPLEFQFSTNGALGLGIEPQAKLHIYEPANSVSELIETSGGTNAWTKVAFKNANGQWDTGTSRGFNNDIYYVDRLGNSSLEFQLATSGALGLGIEPQAKLHIFDPVNSVSHRIQTGGGTNTWTRTEYTNANGQWNVGTARGYNGDQLYFHRQGATAIAFAIQPNGDAFLEGTMSCKVLTIRGGADVAEPFAMSEEISKGAVVVIDDAHPGQLMLSVEAYDSRVAGVVSGANGINPGIALHQEGVIEGGQNVALSGRVYVRADATSGAIKPGDLLTTSSTPGHAMKVGDHTRAQGAILGKAMSSLNEGTGLVLVLVTLQ